jgi:transposase
VWPNPHLRYPGGGSRWLRTALIEAALVTVNTKGSAPVTRPSCVMRHRSHKKAIVAVAHAILQTAYQLLGRGSTYQDLGSDSIDRHHAERLTRRPSPCLSARVARSRWTPRCPLEAIRSPIL